MWSGNAKGEFTFPSGFINFSRVNLRAKASIKQSAHTTTYWNNGRPTNFNVVCALRIQGTGKTTPHRTTIFIKALCVKDDIKRDVERRQYQTVPTVPTLFRIEQNTNRFMPRPENDDDDEKYRILRRISGFATWSHFGLHLCDYILKLN